MDESPKKGNSFTKNAEWAKYEPDPNDYIDI